MHWWKQQLGVVEGHHPSSTHTFTNDRWNVSFTSHPPINTDNHNVFFPLLCPTVSSLYLAHSPFLLVFPYIPHDLPCCLVSDCVSVCRDLMTLCWRRKKSKGLRKSLQKRDLKPSLYLLLCKMALQRAIWSMKKGTVNGHCYYFTVHANSTQKGCCCWRWWWYFGDYLDVLLCLRGFSPLNSLHNKFRQPSDFNT